VKTIKKEIEKLLIDSLKRRKLFSFQKGKDFPGEVFFADDFQHGDYASNVALILASSLQKSPREIALTIVEELREKQPKWLGKIEVAGPGFINFWLSSSFLKANLEEILRKKGKYGSQKEKKTMVIDYSSPNVAKSFGIGHLRSTVIGQATYNLYQFLGWKCIGINHLGDWGTQFGKMIVALRRWASKADSLDLNDLEKLYIKFHREAENEPELEKEARLWFKKLEEGDKEAFSLWKKCLTVSQKEFIEIYKLLGVKIDYHLGESFYYPRVKEVIQEAREKGLTEKSEGALIMNLPGFETPLILEKTDGTTTYASRDLVAIKYRQHRWQPHLLIWEIGREQEFYLQQLFQAAELLGYGRKEQMVHLAHGLIRWSGGRLSTRQGKTVHLREVLNRAVEKAGELMEQSIISPQLTKAEREKIINQVAIGALKFYDLSHYPGKDIIFNWKEVLNLEGNSGPYLQYTVVRGESVLKKANFWRKKISLEGLTAEEEKLLRLMTRFSSIVQEAAYRFSPNLVANFANELGQAFNLFYQRQPILRAPSEKRNFRLALTAGSVQLLKNCFSLLGIPKPKKM
jgi:arginyl-tRNA synthetase